MLTFQSRLKGSKNLGESWNLHGPVNGELSAQLPLHCKWLRQWLSYCDRCTNLSVHLKHHGPTHSWTRLWDTQTPPLEVGSPLQPVESKQPVSFQEPWPWIWRCLSSSQPLLTVAASLPTAHCMSWLEGANRTSSAKSRGEILWSQNRILCGHWLRLERTSDSR